MKSPQEYTALDILEAGEYIKAIMENNPRLTTEGFGVYGWDITTKEREKAFEIRRIAMLDQESREQFLRACSWLFYMDKSKSINTSREAYRTYVLKHAASDWHYHKFNGESYIANGMFIAAAIHADFRFKNVKEERPNDIPDTFINISPKTLKKVCKETEGSYQNYY